MEKETKIPIFGVEIENKIPKLVVDRIVKYDPEVRMTSPAFADDFCREALRLDRKNEEHVYLLLIDAAGGLIGASEMSFGTKSSAPADRKSFGVRVLLSGASFVIAAHNHPSGRLMPSVQDDETCRRFKAAASTIDVVLEDFLVVSSEGYASFKELGKLDEEVA